MAGSANIGRNVAMFEAIHGSAPDIAGQKIANPSGLLNGAVMMLAHLGQTDIADKIKNAWLKTLEDGIHTGDVYQEKISSRKVNTIEFADAIIERLGQTPSQLPLSTLSKGSGTITIPEYKRQNSHKNLVGVDVFIDWKGNDPEIIGKGLTKIDSPSLKLKMITNRGVKVFPHGIKETYCTDHWRCRFTPKLNDNDANMNIEYDHVIALLSNLNQNDFEVIKTENLYEFDGIRGYSLGQGE
jgi:isocitrate dehydrogenase